MKICRLSKTFLYPVWNFRAVNELHQQTQTVSQTKQAELQAEIAALNEQINSKQQEAAQLQAAIDALNAQLPDLLQ